MKFILGKKLNMTQVFKEDGNVVPVTAVLAEPNVITQIKGQDKDGYTAVQLGFGQIKNIKKSQAGHLGKIKPVRTMKEFKVETEDASKLKSGEMVTVNIFESGDKVKVAGTSKGKGFQGVIRRHGFHGAPASHGHKDQERMGGSIGATDAARVFKGMKMPGQMGNKSVTVTGLEIVEVDSEKNILYIKGAVPGAKNGLLLVSGDGEMVLQKNTKNKETQKQDDEKKTEEAKAENKTEEKK